MNIAIVASECAPFAKTGGLADVVGALPRYLAERGADVRVFIPKYDSVDEKKFGLVYQDSLGPFPVRVGGIARTVYIHTAVIPRSTVPVYFIDCREFYHRGTIYTEHWDEDERFILLNKAVIELCQRMQWAPDVFHCNDWQTGLLPVLVKDNYSWDRMFDRTAFLYSIHNIGYQGRFSFDTIAKAELRPEYGRGGLLDHDNSFCMMKGGILFSEVISTVSGTYAQEVLTPEYGSGMQDLLRMRKDDFFGVLNGIDTDEWDPRTDPHIPFHYSADDLAVKRKNTQALLEKTGMTYRPDVPVIGIVSRLVPQKGFDMIAEAIDGLMQLKAQWVILGSGDEEYERLFSAMSRALPQTCWSYIGFNNPLAHLIEAGADMFLMPSRYEPCGLNQMYSLRYGTVPIVRKTGGLADTVHDWHEYQYLGKDGGNGFSFNDANGAALLATVKRAIDSFHLPDEWAAIQRNGMREDCSWQHSAGEYIRLYERAIASRK
ncbi:MAG: glycogen synthase [Bacteroidetes bacterium]|nr:glycogen synthase [Bacteroidota bacterium]